MTRSPFQARTPTAQAFDTHAVVRNPPRPHSRAYGYRAGRSVKAAQNQARPSTNKESKKALIPETTIELAKPCLTPTRVPPNSAALSQLRENEAQEITKRSQADGNPAAPLDSFAVQSKIPADAFPQAPAPILHPFSPTERQNALPSVMRNSSHHLDLDAVGRLVDNQLSGPGAEARQMPSRIIVDGSPDFFVSSRDLNRSLQLHNASAVADHWWAGPPDHHSLYGPQHHIPSSFLSHDAPISPGPAYPPPVYSKLRNLMPDLQTLYELDMPKPEPYNPAYPHPVSAYASRGVNPAALACSGYDKILDHLLQHDRNKLKGSILAGAEGGDVLPPALTMVMFTGEGNGIPERLWTRFESLGAARLQVGAANLAPYARVEPTSGSFVRSATPIGASLKDLPPRFAAAASRLWGNDGLIKPGMPLDHPIVPDPLAAESTDIGHCRHRSPPESSPWFKTEFCSVWEDTGLCKFGTACQYAHGLDDLRVPSQIVPLPTPPLESKALEDKFAPDGTFPYPYHMDVRSQPNVALNSSERRRTSAPPYDLSTVSEVDEEVLPRWAQGCIAPIGAERTTSLGAVSKSRSHQSITSMRRDVPSHKSSPDRSTSASSSSWIDELGQTSGWSPVERISDLASSCDGPSVVHRGANDRSTRSAEMGRAEHFTRRSIWS